MYIEFSGKMINHRWIRLWKRSFGLGGHPPLRIICHLDEKDYEVEEFSDLKNMEGRWKEIVKSCEQFGGLKNQD